MKLEQKYTRSLLMVLILIQVMCKYLVANLCTSESRFFFEHPVSKEPVFIFYDACHMIKLIRNTFGNKKLLYNDKNEEINWDYIKKLYDKENNEGLKLQLNYQEGIFSILTRK